MDKLTNIKANLLEMAFVALIVRGLVIGTGFGEAIAISAIVAYLAYGRFLNKVKVSAHDELNKKVDELAVHVQSLKMERSLRRQVNEPQAQTTGSITTGKRIF